MVDVERSLEGESFCGRSSPNRASGRIFPGPPYSVTASQSAFELHALTVQDHGNDDQIGVCGKIHCDHTCP